MLVSGKEQLKDATRLIKSGEKTEARKILIPFLKQHPHVYQAWWLAANAALRDEDAEFACLRVLKLKPDYEPARHMLIEMKLRQAARSLDQRNKAGALSILRPLVERRKDYVGAWLLLAEASPSDIDAMQAYKEVLGLQENHVLAQEKLMALQHKSQQQLSEKFKRYDNRVIKHKFSLGVVLSVIGVIFLMLTCLLLQVMLTGRSNNLPIGQLFNSNFELGYLGQEPTRRTDTLLVGTKHEYHFSGYAKDEFMLMILFTNGNGGSIKNYVQLYGPGKQLITMRNYSAMANLMQLDTTLPATGTYTLVLTGAKDVSQGAYVLELASLPGIQ